MRDDAIIIDVVQGDIDWLFCRAGRATTSRFSEILSPKQMKLSAASKNYALELALERIMDAPLSMDVSSGWMERGINIETDAREWYGMMRGVEVREAGFVQRGTDFGCSPDGLVYEDGEVVGGCEIKCRSALQHSRSVLGWRDIAEATQIQGSLWVTGLPWWDVVAYCPGLPGRIVRTLPDPDWQEAFDAHLPVFMRGVERARAQLEAFRPVRFDDDLEQLLEASVADMYDEVSA